MFVRSKMVRGKTYYQVVETYRDGRRVRHRTLASLGRFATIEDAYLEAHKWWARCGARLGEPEFFWGPMVKLDALRERPHGWARMLEESRRRRLEEEYAESARRMEELLRSLGGARDCFADLGLSARATAAEVKAAYRRLAKEHHPDRGGDAAAFRRINEAYEEALARAAS